jgi:hypothetical protein
MLCILYFVALIPRGYRLPAKVPTKITVGSARAEFGLQFFKTRNLIGGTFLHDGTRCTKSPEAASSADLSVIKQLPLAASSITLSSGYRSISTGSTCWNLAL